ncbi:MAG TPA: lysylphosphatidylglycerol synthase transmembrane domain-containing protein [Anaerolineales bacterium]
MNQPSEIFVPTLRPAGSLKNLRRAGIYLVAAALLVFALRGIPLASIWESLRHLAAWQIGILLVVNALVILSMTLRWWLVVRAEKSHLPFLPFIACRLAMFSVSYFTPGPQLGGEPLQILFLRREHGQSLARAVSTVIIDKLLEFLGNFLFIALGLFAFLSTGALPGVSLPQWIWVLLGLVLSWPLLHLFLLARSRLPITYLLKTFASRFHKHKWFRTALVSERLGAAFVRRHPAFLLGALFASLLGWSAMAAEYMLILNFLRVQTGFLQALSALTASLLAFLVPLPGGLGALEASQVLALGSLGYPAALAISVTLLLRMRDLLNGGIGLIFAAHLFHR